MLERKKYELKWGEETLFIETGALAPLTNGSCRVQLGDTVVLATAVMSDQISDLDYFPLMVDYKENLYAAGKISGSRFMKREGRPTDEAVLTGRIVDRSVRPLFDDRMRFDMQIVLNVLSLDEKNDPDVPSLIAASVALSISDIPWAGPIAGVGVAMMEDGELVLNPSFEQKEESLLNTLIASDGERLVMMEGDGRQAPEDKTFKAIQYGVEQVKPVVDLVKKIQKEIGKEKVKFVPPELADEQKQAQEKAKTFFEERIKELFGFTSKKERGEKEHELKDQCLAEIDEEHHGLALQQFEEVYAQAFKDLALNDGNRVDNRAFDQVRDLAVEVDLLPRTHGSGLFQRGETQVLSVLTLGSPGDEQLLDGMEISGTKRYMHHYNFLSFCVGEVRPLRGPSRRDIGHGALAEKALVPVIPVKEDFPYTIRIVSEVLASNGSSSQGSICGSTLSLMAAGVPIKNPVAGIAMGLVSSEDGKTWKLLTDIQGVEDHEGDMDFKIAGTKEGVTAIQLDIKLGGISLEVVEATFEEAKKARMKILDEMLKVIAEPRKEMSKYAPRIEKMQIDPEKIREVIGPGGKVINEIIDATEASIDIEDDGMIFITSADGEKMKQAIKMIQDIIKEVEVGEIYEGEIVKIVTDRNNPSKEIGAIVQLTANQDGMIHISAVENERIDKITDFIKTGDVVKVKVTGVDKEKGRIELSRKALLKGDDRKPGAGSTKKPKPIPFKKQE